MFRLRTHALDDDTAYSYDLGQAVAVCLYEMVRSPEAHAGLGIREAASAAEVERFLTLFREALEATGYTRRHPSNCSEAQLRRLVLRMGLTAADLPVWMGILRQILWRIETDREANQQE